MNHFNLMQVIQEVTQTKKPPILGRSKGVSELLDITLRVIQGFLGEKSLYLSERTDDFLLLILGNSVF